ncbi:MAG: hypothetical protein ACLQT7_02805 [Candidatus Dormibacteria bacterium]
MLRHLARLGRSVPFAGERALAVAVYADGLNEPVRASESGYEGVACVDDAARALDLYCALWKATRLPWVRSWCDGLLDFILAMQGADGRWVNFILDWEGTPNRVGRTSVAGGHFWQARAVLALAHAGPILGDPRIEPALRRGLPHILAATEVASDVRALHIGAALALADQPDDQGLGERLPVWSEELLSCREQDMLMNSPDERGAPHLWGHIQEGVLAEAAVRLGRDDWLAVASRSAELVFASAVRGGFDLARVQPYDVASAVYTLSRLAETTGDPAFAALVTLARAWFDGRNPAGQPVYDRREGRVGDGIDQRVVSTRSGAEANIVGAEALFDDAVAVARRLRDSEGLPHGPASLAAISRGAQ